MYDRELVIEVLSQILSSARRIVARFKAINSANDFVASEEGLEKLDGICMQLIAIGESLKNLDRVTDSKLLEKYSEVDWRSAKGMRDVISHQYFDLNEEAVFDVCENNISTLIETVGKIIEDQKHDSEDD